MSMIDRSLDGMAVLSGHLGSVLKRRLREASGIALISLAILATIALATWSVHDPSLSHATNAHVHNWLGVPGAVAADLMMQLLGLGSLALLLPIAIWGYRLLGHRPLSHERLRVLLWVCGTTLTATFASSLPRSAHWPLPNGLGGVVGDAVMKLPAIVHERAARRNLPHRDRDRHRRRGARHLRRRRGPHMARSTRSRTRGRDATTTRTMRRRP